MTIEEAIERLQDEIEEYTPFKDKWDGAKADIDALTMAIKALEQEPKTGHWIYSKAVNTGEIIFSECSVCGNGESRCAKRMNYCPNCGAKMEEELNERFRDENQSLCKTKRNHSKRSC